MARLGRGKLHRSRYPARAQAWVHRRSDVAVRLAKDRTVEAPEATRQWPRIVEKVNNLEPESGLQIRPVDHPSAVGDGAAIILYGSRDAQDRGFRRAAYMRGQ